MSFRLIILQAELRQAEADQSTSQAWLMLTVIDYLGILDLSSR